LTSHFPEDYFFTIRGIMPEGHRGSNQVEDATTAQISERMCNSAITGLQYDAATDQYTYVWKTDKSWAGTCRQLSLAIEGATYRRTSHFK
jgi:hypothetical protein